MRSRITGTRLGKQFIRLSGASPGNSGGISAGSSGCEPKAIQRLHIHLVIQGAVQWAVRIAIHGFVQVVPDLLSSRLFGARESHGEQHVELTVDIQGCTDH
jgi:hypothetical protein